MMDSGMSGAVLLGAVADDLTGATDLSLILARQGLRTVQTVGIPDDGVSIGDAEAVVVALKSRTIPAPEAVDLSLRSARWLKGIGARQLFFKYCSTFDSTDRGNIGPVADALLTQAGEDITIACPAFPANGRTVYRGHLFVNGMLLSDSPMKDHPLTPMRDSNLVRVLQRQVRGRVGLVAIDVVEAGPEAVGRAIEQGRAEGVRFLVVDAITDRHLLTIARAARGLGLVTGGSALAMGLPRDPVPGPRTAPEPDDAPFRGPQGRAVALAGSCSTATRAQIEAELARGAPAFRLDGLAVAAGTQTVAEIVDWVAAQEGALPPLVYSSADPDEVRTVQQRLGTERAGDMMETVFGQVAASLSRRGFSRFVVAGGETSGAVVGALGVKTMTIGPEIAPGVPWTRSTGHPDIALALKSGNFGTTDFFERAWSRISNVKNGDIP